MASDFDPYYKWLGIPPKDQPPHHYRLLGIELYESDGDVIDAAANRLMAYLRDLSKGQAAEHSQRLLNEISKARICLLNDNKKTAYDAQLKKDLEPVKRPPPPPPPVADGGAASAPPVASSSAGVVPMMATPVAATPPSVSAPAVPNVPAGSTNAAGFRPPPPSAADSASVAAPPVEENGEPKADVRRASASSKTNKKVFIAVIGGGGLLALMAILAIAMASQRSDPAPPVKPPLIIPPPVVKAPDTKPTLLNLAWPEDERIDAIVEIDGVPKITPPQGPVEYELPPGSQELVIHRKGYEDVAVTINLNKNQTTTFRPSWIVATETPVTVATDDPIDLAAGLVGYWPFENDLVDYSDNHYDAENDDPAYAPGKVGAGINASTVTRIDRPLVAGADAVTITFWLQATALPADGAALLDGDKLRWEMQGVWPQLTLQENPAAGPTIGYSGIKLSSEVGKWAHLAATYDKATSQVDYYLNGVKSGSRTIDPAPQIYLGPLKAGGFAGLIDELRIYRRALPAAEIAAIYQHDQLPLAEAPTAPTGKVYAQMWRNTRAYDLDRDSIRDVIAQAPTQTVELPAVAIPVDVESLLNGKFLENRKPSFARIRGFVYPPETSEYTLEVKGDGYARVYTRTSTVAGLNEITSVGFGDSAKSPALALQADQPYYVEVVYQSNRGAPDLSLRWTSTSGVDEDPIAAARFAPYPGVEPDLLLLASTPATPDPAPAPAATLFVDSPTAVELSAHKPGDSPITLATFTSLEDPSKLTLQLFGGDEVAPGKASFVMTPQGAGKWTIRLDSATGAGPPVAAFAVVDQKLQFGWMSDAATTAFLLRNCLLQATVESERELLRLRQPIALGVLPVAESAGKTDLNVPTTDLSVVTPVQLEITGLQGSIPPPDDFKPVTIKSREKDYVYLSPQGEPRLLGSQVTLLPVPADGSTLIKTQLVYQLEMLPAKVPYIASNKQGTTHLAGLTQTLQAGEARWAQINPNLTRKVFARTEETYLASKQKLVDDIALMGEVEKYLAPNSDAVFEARLFIEVAGQQVDLAKTGQ